MDFPYFQFVFCLTVDDKVSDFILGQIFKIVFFTGYQHFCLLNNEIYLAIKNFSLFSGEYCTDKLWKMTIIFPDIGPTI